MQSKLYELEVQREGIGTLRARLEVPGALTLAALFDILHRMCELGSRTYRFHAAADAFDDERSFGSRDSDAGFRADRTQLARLALRERSQLLCEVGHEDELELVRLTVRGVREAGARDHEVRELECSGSNQPTPEQLARIELEQEWREVREGLGAELVEVIERSFERREDSVEDLRREHALARRVLDWTQPLPEALFDLEELTERDLLTWLASLPEHLAQAGLGEEALELCELGLRTASASPFLAAKLACMVETNRAAEVRELAVEALAQHPDERWIAINAARVFDACGDTESALATYRALAKQTNDAELIDFFGGKIVELLERAGRGDEARAANAARLARMAAAFHADEDAPELAAPDRIGRNEPCPCGSGRKFKRCCGARNDPTDAESRMYAEWLGELMRFAQRQPEFDAPGEWLASFGGEEFRELSLAEAMPLLSGEDSEAYFMQWAVLDAVNADGRSLVGRFLASERARGTPRERAILERMRDACVELYEITAVHDGGVGRLRALLDPARPERNVLLGTDELPVGLVIAARVVELDGSLQLLPGVLDFPSSQRDELVRTLQAAHAASGLDWPTFLRRNSQRFHHFAREKSLAT